MFEKLEELAKNNKKISDFHIRSGWPLAFRQTGEIHKVPEVVVKSQDLQDLLEVAFFEMTTHSRLPWWTSCWCCEQLLEDFAYCICLFNFCWIA